MRHYFITYTVTPGEVKSDLVTSKAKVDLNSYKGLRSFIRYMKGKFPTFELLSWKVLK